MEPTDAHQLEDEELEDQPDRDAAAVEANPDDQAAQERARASALAKHEDQMQEIASIQFEYDAGQLVDPAVPDFMKRDHRRVHAAERGRGAGPA